MLEGEKVFTKPAFLLGTDPEHEAVVSHVDEVDRLQRTVFNSLARQDPLVNQLLAASTGSKISKGSNEQCATCRQCPLRNEAQALEMVPYQPVIGDHKHIVRIRKRTD